MTTKFKLKQCQERGNLCTVPPYPQLCKNSLQKAHHIPKKSEFFSFKKWPHQTQISEANISISVLRPHLHMHIIWPCPSPRTEEREKHRYRERETSPCKFLSWILLLIFLFTSMFFSYYPKSKALFLLLLSPLSSPAFVLSFPNLVVPLFFVSFNS